MMKGYVIQKKANNVADWEDTEKAFHSAHEAIAFHAACAFAVSEANSPVRFRIKDLENPESAED